MTEYRDLDIERDMEVHLFFFGESQIRWEGSSEGLAGKCSSPRFEQPASGHESSVIFATSANRPERKSELYDVIFTSS
jgi:hypothetical protein